MHACGFHLIVTLAGAGKEAERRKQQGGERGGEKCGEENLEKGWAVDFEFAANEADESAFEREVKHQRETDEHGGDEPFAILKECPDELHQVACRGEEQDREPLRQRLTSLAPPQIVV